MVGRTFRYDANGNQESWDHDQNGTRRTLVWDDENRLQSLFDNGHEKAYVYDDAGQRVIKRGPQGETVYVNQWFTMRNGQAGTKHVFAGTERIVSKLMKQDDPGANPKGKTPFEKDLYYFHPDHLGSSAYVTDAKAKLYQHLEYFPFGETWVEEVSNTQRTPYWYTAKELDEETGLYYYGARYYDPRTSVWQSADPALPDYLPKGSAARNDQLLNGGVFNSLSLAMYTYGNNNPVKYNDPDGRSACNALQGLPGPSGRVAAGGCNGIAYGGLWIGAAVAGLFGVTVGSQNDASNMSSGPYADVPEAPPAPPGWGIIGDPATATAMTSGEVTPGLQNLIDIAVSARSSEGNRGSVRIQLQTGSANISSIDLAGGPAGVTKLQATGGLAFVWADGMAADPSFARNPAYNSAVVKLSAKINNLTGGGMQKGGTALQEFFQHKGQTYRFDVEVNQGTHFNE